MNGRLTILSAQMNPVVGDVQGNLELARQALAEGRAQGADLVVLPELFLIGYPPEDLVLKPSIVAACRKAVMTLAKEVAKGPGLVVGAPWVDGDRLHNAALLLDGGKVVAASYKHELPNYGVFDEKRVFDAGPLPVPVDFRGLPIGLPICEDIWFDRVPRALAAGGARMLVVPNGSPWRRGVREERAKAFSAWADLKLPYVFVNQVGGQDELAFDGASFAADEAGRIVQQLPNFESAFGLSIWEPVRGGLACVHAERAAVSTSLEETWRAAMTGLGDYVRKTGFPGVLLGLSGGVDSAIVAAIAADALGPDKVWCVMLPSKFTSSDSTQDAAACAALLGVKLTTIPIHSGVSALSGMLHETFEGLQADTTEENIQSRLRGVTLMALSNKFGHMVVTTGNKSEMAVGYATLYGDMCGGYNPLKDLYKTEVYALARWRNAHHPRGGKGPAGQVIPERILTKAPSAELRPDQTDQDSLPPYEVLDAILQGLVEEEASCADIVKRGFDETTVRRVERLLHVNEYKRRQAPPGMKVGSRAFGRDRRYPLVNRWRDG